MKNPDPSVPLTLLTLMAAMAVLALACGGSGDDDDSAGAGDDDSAGGDDDSDNADDDGGDDDGGDDDAFDDDAGDDTDDDADDDTSDDDTAPDFPLEIGDTVPDFEMEAHDGSTFRLSDYAGSKVLLSTNPKADSAVCSLQMKTLDDTYYDDFTDRGVIPFGTSADTHDEQVAWAEHCGLSSVLLLSDSDPKGYVAGMFGMYNEFGGFDDRGNVLIDENRVFIYIQHTPITQVPDFQAILDWLDAR